MWVRDVVDALWRSRCPLLLRVSDIKKNAILFRRSRLFYSRLPLSWHREYPEQWAAACLRQSNRVNMMIARNSHICVCVCCVQGEGGGCWCQRNHVCSNNGTRAINTREYCCSGIVVRVPGATYSPICVLDIRENVYMWYRCVPFWVHNTHNIRNIAIVPTRTHTGYEPIWISRRFKAAGSYLSWFGGVFWEKNSHTHTRYNLTAQSGIWHITYTQRGAQTRQAELLIK